MDPTVTPVVAPPAAPSAPIDPAKALSYIARLRDNQNFGAALAGGLLGALIGAALWAVITVLTKFQIGWEAIGVGFLVGLGVRTLGRGVDPVFGYVGAALSLFGIVLGNILSAMIFVSADQHIPFLELASRMTLSAAWIILTAGFNPIDLLFYGLGVYYGYRNSFHRPTNQELAALS